MTGCGSGPAIRTLTYTFSTPFMSVPGVGVVTATSFVTPIEDPAKSKHSGSVGAFVGLTTKRYQSGEIDYDGHISRRGDSHLRGLLYDSAAHRTKSECDLCRSGLQSCDRLGFMRAAVDVARKLALIAKQHWSVEPASGLVGSTSVIIKSITGR